MYIYILLKATSKIHFSNLAPSIFDKQGKTLPKPNFSIRLF